MTHKIKITKNGAYFKSMGQWISAPCHHEGCLIQANNYYWNEVFLCEKHYQEAKKLTNDFIKF